MQYTNGHPLYEDASFFYIRKPHTMPTTFGDQQSFLEQLFDTSNNKSRLVQNQTQHFSRDEEYGLCNRLDNDTAGLLYFAKNKEIFTTYRKQQSQHHVWKIYLADVEGDVEQTNTVAYPIAHHKHAQDRMVAVKTQKNISKTKGKLHHVETYIQKLYYDKTTNRSTIQVRIQRGIRHQIRCHLASIGAPIIGDKIYNKKQKTGNLCLWSVGLLSD